jgi:hypothetical protein
LCIDIPPRNRWRSVVFLEKALDAGLTVVLEILGKAIMQEDKFNMSMRKFLKQVGVTSQREIERIVREQRPPKGPLKVKMVLTAEGTDLRHVVEGDIDLG